MEPPAWKDGAEKEVIGDENDDDDDSDDDDGIVIDWREVERTL